MTICVPVILGPTAVGKTEVALKLAADLDCEIVSCDSRQIYKYMNIGTAKPSTHDLSSIRHWLIDYLKPSQNYSAYHFSQDAHHIIHESALSGKKIIICGGTGFYFKSLLEGLSPRIQSDIQFRNHYIARVLKEGNKSIFNELTKYDPETAKKLHPNDIQRVIRALQVYFQTGYPLSYHIKKRRPPPDISYLVFILLLDRQSLYQRINRRVDSMFTQGLWEEFLSLRKMGFTLNDPGMHCVGYEELFKVEDNSIHIDQAVEEIKKNSRNYAKRQITWFSNKTHGTHIDVTTGENAYSIIKKRIVQFLKE